MLVSVKAGQVTETATKNTNKNMSNTAFNIIVECQSPCRRLLIETKGLLEL